MFNFVQVLCLIFTSFYHHWASWQEDRLQKPPGELVDVGGYKLHLCSKGTGKFTVIIDHSLGGLDGYFLLEEIAKLTKVCIYDRAGYGWSDRSPKTRCSLEIVRELDYLLSQSNIEPPYILVGNSFGSYNVRLYAHYFPQKVLGIILTDGLHEKAMLKLPLWLKLLKLFFMSGFAMSTFGSFLGLIRLLGKLGTFELIKPELKNFPTATVSMVKRSFYRHNHWITMWREMWNLDLSAKQVSEASSLGNIPLITIKANTFFKRSPWNIYMPLQAADHLRDTMHTELLKLSQDSTQLIASQSSHFVWIDEPEAIVTAIKQLLVKS